MTEEQKSFLMYGNWQPLFSCLSDEDAGKLIKALFDFAVNGIETGCLPPNVEGLYIFMSETIKQNMSKWEESKKKRIEAGRLGGLAKSSNAKQSQAMLSNSKQSQDKPSNAKHNVNVNVNGNVNTKDKEILSKESTKKDASRFLAPSLPEIESYIREKNLDDLVNAESFFTFYESKGWFVGKSKMRDWKAAVRGWASRTKEEKQTTATQTEQQRARLMAILEEPDEERGHTPW